MDLTRSHYSAADLTAPSYRLEYIKAFAPKTLMYHFLLSTAAFRCMTSNDNPPISQSLRGTLQKDAEMQADFMDEMIRIHKNDGLDVRHGVSCPEWHVHEVTKVCVHENTEPWAKD